MASPLQDYSDNHRTLLEAAASQGGLVDPLPVNLDEFYAPLLQHARRKELLPIDGVMIRDWDPDNRKLSPGVHLGMRVYEIEGVRFIRVRFPFHDRKHWGGLDFIAVGRADYRKFYQVALRCRRDQAPPSLPPVLAPAQLELLKQNTFNYLEPANLKRIKAFGGRAKRGVLLMGPPGNGKTMACRWIWEECRRRRWEWRLVTPDAYRQARSCDSVHQLFSVERRGIVFFDDMDLALRDRETVRETDDQAVFLNALDGITVHEGVVFVFTSNCAPELIDRAFKRPGRLDVVLNFENPDRALRCQLFERWHEHIRHNVGLDLMADSTEGYSFAEIEELKNLLIMRFMETQSWDWEWALDQFDVNRAELMNRPQPRLGFGQSERSRSSEEDDIPF